MKIFIAVPCMDMVQTDFFRSCVGLDVQGEVQWTTCQSSLVYDARNKLTDIAIDDGFDRVLWIDSDMVFDRHLFRRLSEHLDLGREMVTGLCFSRKPPIHPTIYKEFRMDITPEGRQEPVAEIYDDYERDSLFPIAGCGFAAVMTTTDLLRRVRDKFGLPFWPQAGFGEDFSFCLRARDVGAEMWCDSSIKVGHAGYAIYDEETYRDIRGLTD